MSTWLWDPTNVIYKEDQNILKHVTQISYDEMKLITHCISATE